MLLKFLPDVAQFNPILLAMLAASLIAARYLLFAGGALTLLRLFRARVASRRIQPRGFTRKQLWREFGWSMSTVAIFASIAALSVSFGRDSSLTRVYWDPAQHGHAWLLLSLPLTILLHDFYFYWTHRFMHLPGVFERVHHVHHRSTNPSPLAVLAFHPIEALIEGGAVLFVTLLIPVHISVLAIWALYALLTNIMGHLGHELLPAGLASNRWLGWINTATGHNQHHRSFNANYGLYTLIWDRLMGTTHPGYADLYARTTAPEPALFDEKAA